MTRYDALMLEMQTLAADLAQAVQANQPLRVHALTAAVVALNDALQAHIKELDNHELQVRIRRQRANSGR